MSDDRRAEQGVPPAERPGTEPGLGTTGTGGLVGVVGSLGVAGLLVSAVAILTWPLLAGLVGAVAFAVALVAVNRGTFGPLGAATVALCAPVIGAGLVGAVGGTWLLQTAESFPTSTSAQVPDASLFVAATVGLALGLAIAVAGLAVLVGGGADRERLRSLRRAAVRGGTLPAVAASLFVLGGLLSPGRTTALGPVEALAAIVSWLVGPASGPDALLPFLVLCLAAVGTIRAVAPGRWPGARNPAARRLVPDPRALLTGLVAVLVVLLGAVLIVHLRRSPLGVRRTVATLGLDPLVGLTGRQDLRLSLGLLATGVLPLALRNRLATLRQRETPADIGRAVAPHVSGLVLLVLTAVVARPSIAAGREWIATRLPGPTSDAFLTGSEQVLRTVGTPAIALLVVTGLIAVSIGLVVGLAGAQRFGLLRADRAGSAVAAAGLVVATGFAGARGAGPVVVVAGVVAGLLVWDTGAFGATLRQEIGRGGRRLELVHGLASLGVGIGAGLVAWLAVERVPGGLLTGGSAGVTALAVVLLGLALVLTALR